MTSFDENINIESNEISEERDIKKSFLIASKIYNPSLIKETDKSVSYLIYINDESYYVYLDKINNNYIKIDYPLIIQKKLKEIDVLKSANENNKKIKAAKTNIISVTDEETKLIISLEMFIFSNEMIRTIDQIIKRFSSIKDTSIKNFISKVSGKENV